MVENICMDRNLCYLCQTTNLPDSTLLDTLGQQIDFEKKVHIGIKVCV